MVLIGVSRADITDNIQSIVVWRRDNRLSLSFLAKIEEVGRLVTVATLLPLRRRSSVTNLGLKTTVDLCLSPLCVSIFLS
jgi:hypothetical protein